MTKAKYKQVSQKSVRKSWISQVI